MLNKCKCPLRLYEYMSCGLPIVATKVGEPAYVLKDGNGLLVEPNANSIAEGIMTLLEDEELAKSLSDRGRELIIKEYNWVTLGKKLVKYYEDIMSTKKD